MHSLGAGGTLDAVDDKLKQALIVDYRTADISDLNKHVLDYATKITNEASSITQEYIDSLKRDGLSDIMLHDIVQAAAYFNYVNRLADSLGVEMEEG